MRIFEGKHVVVLERDGWEFVERRRAKEAVAIIAIAEGRLILTEQFRRPVGARVIDLPAGLIEQFDAGETARRELFEETGYACDRVERIATAATSPGITSERVHFFRAVGGRPEGAGGGVEGEQITVHAVPMREIRAWLESQQEAGMLIDVKVWAGLYFAS